MATLPRLAYRTAYVDTPDAPSTPKPKKVSKRDRTPRLMKLANRHLQEQGIIPTEPDDRREMGREDIANVEFINSSDLDSIFDSLIESVSFQHALEDCECRWNVADVDTDLLDLSEPTLERICPTCSGILHVGCSFGTRLG